MFRKPRKHTALERILLLLDKGSFTEIDEEEGVNHPKDGVIIGVGKIDGRQVCVFSQDFSLKGGSVGEIHARRIARIMDIAIKTGCPIIGIEESAGARIDEGVKSLDGYARIFYKNMNASGVVPQISIIMGTCAGGAVYSPALTDFVITIRNQSRMFITGPDVVRSVMSENVGPDELGGADVHSKISGVAHFEEESEEEAITKARKLLSYLPSNNQSDPPLCRKKDRTSRKTKLRLPDKSKTYDMKAVIKEIFDAGTFLEVQSNYATNIITGFARMGQCTVGVVANQPEHLAGCLDIDASEKAARFVRFCDAFNIPLVNLVDVPGYLPGKEQESHGIIRHGAELLFAYAEATVPKIALIVRKAYGGAYIVLASKEMHYDFTIAFPDAEVAVMGAAQAADILYRNDPEKGQKMAEYQKRFLNTADALKNGSIDKVIRPEETRQTLYALLNSIQSKRERRLPKKHANNPL